MVGFERDEGKGEGGKRMGKIAPLGEAATQIRKGGRALVREVKSFFPEPEELDARSLRKALEEVEERIEGEDMAGALERFDEGLAPILAGPNHAFSRRRGRRFLSLLLSLLGIPAILLLVWWVLSRV